jgi:hypothetical protein
MTPPWLTSTWGYWLTSWSALSGSKQSNTESDMRLNTWFRFKDPFYGLGTPVKPLKKLIDSGLLGWPLKVTISKHTGFDWKFYWVGKTHLEPQPVPQELDYDMWLGPAPYKPYNAHRVH